ncbi:hypothetical protein EGK75_01165 [Neisseria weixii]|uniref:Terminase n=1 Tax=Neisseria weixii TaxID=1853276 RepID=A0A3N4N575_9NEIS|nr:hypothetical protein [Neisseria weixii]RPD90505.1 hypothetical protein EGK74_01780 [Neisseria weixii]RPD90553.1 hypothetical protein EGK75_01165 [Neisseria weixii]
MALKGQKRRFAEAIVSARPLKISNREAALRIGCSENSASASGSRCMADVEVRAYIVAHWPDYFEPIAPNTPVIEKAEAPQAGLPLFCARDIAAWLKEGADAEDLAVVMEAVSGLIPEKPPNLAADSILPLVEGMDKDDSLFLNLVKAVCDKLALSTDPLDFWDSILASPWTTTKEKMAASAEKAKYTKAKPATQSKKENALSDALAARFGAKPPGKDKGASLLHAAGISDDEEGIARHYGLNTKVPQWQN